MRPTLALLGVCTLLSVAAAGCGSQATDLPVPTRTQAAERLAGAPAPLAALHRQGGALLDGGQATFDARIAELAGRPIVVNAWASWCGPCKQEIPFFQRSAVRYGKRIGFLGLNVDDAAEKAHAFLRDHYLAYPSYVDADERIARGAGVRAGLPTTIYYDRDGRVAFVHQGQYRDEAQLRADIARYALRS
jgi:cytochrome c biogenesis protein CcmG, thiol:disulfide interchange protein DsbE